jgi:APA family basic amino acid/polyamine antiporter
MVLRFTDPKRVRPFKTPAVFIVAPASIVGCIVLFLALDEKSKTLFLVWTVVGLVLYFCYGFWRSHVRLGLSEVHELDDDAPPGAVAPMPGAASPTEDR